VEHLLNKERLQGLARQYNIELSLKQLAQMQIYSGLLVEWNGCMNLTAITVPQEMEVKHFLDSLLFAALPEVQGSLVDVGSGAGFPGMVAKIYKPGLAVTLMEPNGKRVSFLQEISRATGLPVEVVKERGEEAARKQWRESFDVATARAVAALPALCEFCLPLVKVDGLFIAMKGGVEEAETGQTACQKLGGEVAEVKEFTLPDGSARSLVMIQKVKETPTQYPRNGGVIAKRPL
jgi:16S rRNA (guanine527-N7)-methyltransferase